MIHNARVSKRILSRWTGDYLLNPIREAIMAHLTVNRYPPGFASAVTLDHTGRFIYRTPARCGRLVDAWSRLILPDGISVLDTVQEETRPFFVQFEVPTREEAVAAFTPVMVDTTDTFRLTTAVIERNRYNSMITAVTSTIQSARPHWRYVNIDHQWLASWRIASGHVNQLCHSLVSPDPGNPLGPCGERGPFRFSLCYQIRPELLPARRPGPAPLP